MTVRFSFNLKGILYINRNRLLKISSNNAFHTLVELSCFDIVGELSVTKHKLLDKESNDLYCLTFEMLFIGHR